jgi:hypothetical protein
MFFILICEINVRFDIIPATTSPLLSIIDIDKITWNRGTEEKEISTKF